MKYVLASKEKLVLESMKYLPKVKHVETVVEVVVDRCELNVGPFPFEYRSKAPGDFCPSD